MPSWPSVSVPARVPSPMPAAPTRLRWSFPVIAWWPKTDWVALCRVALPILWRSNAGCSRMNSDNALLLDEFTDRLWLEEGLSRNTLESYRRDLMQFAEWLEKHAGKNLLSAERVDIE